MPHGTALERFARFTGAAIACLPSDINPALASHWTGNGRALSTFLGTLKNTAEHIPASFESSCKRLEKRGFVPFGEAVLRNLPRDLWELEDYWTHEEDALRARLRGLASRDRYVACLPVLAELRLSDYPSPRAILEGAERWQKAIPRWLATLLERAEFPEPPSDAVLDIVVLTPAELGFTGEKRAYIKDMTIVARARALHLAPLTLQAAGGAAIIESTFGAHHSVHPMLDPACPGYERQELLAFHPVALSRPHPAV